jgi:hypothetical protein
MVKVRAKLRVVCVDNDGYSASLARGKLYVKLPDRAAAKHELARIIDESGEDYLYPEALFRTGLRSTS